MTIGEKIRKYRKEKGLTQKKLAELSELATITIRQYEANKYKPKFESLQRIANVLNIDVNILSKCEEKTYQIIGIHSETETYYVYPAATIEEFKKKDKNLKGSSIEELIYGMNMYSEYIHFYREV